MATAWKGSPTVADWKIERMTENHAILDIRWRRSPFGDTLEPLESSVHIVSLTRLAIRSVADDIDTRHAALLIT